MTINPRRTQRPRLAVIGAPVEDGLVGVRGASLGPAALRAAGLVDLLQNSNYQIRDLGDVTPSSLGPSGLLYRELDLGGLAHRAAAVARWTQAISDATLAVARRGDVPIVLGGDHAMSIGSIHGMARHWAEQDREMHVLWLDAHADLNTPLTTPSGNLHGMVLAALTGEPMLGPLFGGFNRVQVDPNNILMLGVRSVDRGEADRFMWGGFRVAGRPPGCAPRIMPALRSFLDAIAARGGALHVSFDVDVLDPEIAPGVGTPEAGGLCERDLFDIMHMVKQSGLAASLDIVEVNPLRDRDNRTAAIAAEIAASLFAETTAEISSDPFAAPRAEQHHDQVSTRVH